jgi:hypothetical protein
MLNTACLLATLVGVIQADNPVPAEVISQLEFMAGQWKPEGTFGGVTWQGTSRRRFSKSKTALMMTSETNIMEAVRVTGWAPDKNELVETGYNFSGTRVVIPRRGVPVLVAPCRVRLPHRVPPLQPPLVYQIVSGRLGQDKVDRLDDSAFRLCQARAAARRVCLIAPARLNRSCTPPIG